MRDCSIKPKALDLDLKMRMVCTCKRHCLDQILITLILAYSTYDKPLFNQSSTSIYRYRGENHESEVLGSTNAEDLENAIRQDKFGTRKGFQGAEGGASSSGPVEFERETLGKPKNTDKDVFGLDTFLNKAKKGKRTREDEDDYASDEDRRRRR